jgi:hypothetical protein
MIPTPPSRTPMLEQTTIDQLRALRLKGFIEALQALNPRSTP